MFKKVLFAICLSVLSTNAIHSQTLKIVAVVGKDTITEYDLMKRLHFTLMTMGVPQDKVAEAKARMMPQVLRSMIEDKMKIAEAAKFKLVAGDDEILEEWNHIETANGMPKGSLKEQLQKTGLGTTLLEDQLRAGIVWNKLVSGRYRSSIHISEQQINQKIAELKKLQNKNHYQLSEIVIRPGQKNKASNPSDAMKMAHEVVSHLKQGAPFGSIATQVSSSPSASRGGDIGWVYAPDLKQKIKGTSKTLGNALQSMKVGEVSGPHVTDDGIFILGLRNVTAKLDFKSDDTYKVRVISQPVSKRIKGAVLEASTQKLWTLVKDAKTPEAFLKVQQRFGATPEMSITKSQFFNSVEAEDRPTLEKLTLHQPSRPILSDGVLMVFMINAIEKGKTGEPSRDVIKHQLMEEKLAAYEKQYLKNLYNQFMVDVRLKS